VAGPFNDTVIGRSIGMRVERECSVLEDRLRGQERAAWIGVGVRNVTRRNEER
jgi:hypothetical protein